MRALIARLEGSLLPRERLRAVLAPLESTLQRLQRHARIVPAGSTLRLVLTEDGMDYLPSPCAAIGLRIADNADSVLSLPLIERGEDDERWFDAPPWWEQQEIPGA